MRAISWRFKSSPGHTAFVHPHKTQHPTLPKSHFPYPICATTEDLPVAFDFLCGVDYYAIYNKGMKIAFVGKGGSGKTTLASIAARYLAARKMPVLAIDADINQHLGQSLGLSEKDASRIPAMGLEMNRIKEYLIGSNTGIGDVSEMVKTTPPGAGSLPLPRIMLCTDTSSKRLMLSASWRSDHSRKKISAQSATTPKLDRLKWYSTI